MIDEEWRYFAPGGAVTPGGPSTWDILDWDQRRIIAVTMEDEQESADVAVEHFKKHIDTLGPGVYAINVSPDGDVVSVSTDPQDDQTTCVYYPPLDAILLRDRVETVLRSDLLEQDRLSPNVDLVSYKPYPNSTKTREVVFKYYFVFQFLHKMWHEMNLWMRLPPHPNIVPFDRLVLDELHGNVVGFTSVFIPGGTIGEDKSRAFKLEWLRQLTRVIDDLNLKYGIVHQDVAARNLLVDPKTDAIMLFDFNYSGRVGYVGCPKERDDVKGVIFALYEIITHDMHFRQVPYHQQDSADVQGLEEWVQHPDVKLDHSVSAYRSVLNKWVKERREGRHITHFGEAAEYIDWPHLPQPPPKKFVYSDRLGNAIVHEAVVLSVIRRDKREKGAAVLNWERPAQNKLGKGHRLFANGEFVH